MQKYFLFFLSSFFLFLPVCHGDTQLGTVSEADCNKASGKCYPYGALAGGGTCPEDLPIMYGKCQSPDMIYCCTPEGTTPTTETVPTVSSTPTASFNYTLLEPIPGQGNSSDFASYVKALYLFTLSAVGIAALLMVIIGGYFYVTSAGNSSLVTKGKGLITDAILGIVVAFASWLVLYIINPDLVEIDLGSLKALEVGDGGEFPETPSTPYTGPNNGCGKIAQTALQMANKDGCLYSMEHRSNHCSTVPGYFDCSSLVVYSYQQAGCKSPGNTTTDMYQKATDFNGDSAQLKAGDALVYDQAHNPSGGSTGHIVICLENGCNQVAHASTAHPKSGDPKDQIKVSDAQHYKDINGIRVLHASQFCSDSAATGC